MFFKQMFTAKHFTKSKTELLHVLSDLLKKTNVKKPVNNRFNKRSRFQQNLEFFAMDAVINL